MDREIKKRCSATTQKGSRCQLTATGDSRYCHVHLKQSFPRTILTVLSDKFLSRLNSLGYKQKFIRDAQRTMGVYLSIVHSDTSEISADALYEFVETLRETGWKKEQIQLHIALLSNFTH